MEAFTRGPRGGKLRKARWTTGTLYDREEDTVCALGALGEAYAGNAEYADSRSHFKGNFGKAADLVASCVPKKYNVEDGLHIPDWNDELSEKRGFTSIKRVFCAALKKSMGRKVSKTTSKRKVKRAA